MEGADSKDLRNHTSGDHMAKLSLVDNQRRDNIFFRCVEDSNETIMISDESGRLIYVNPAWCSTYGYTPEEAIGQTPRLLHSGFQDEEFYKTMWNDIRDPEIANWKGELVNKTKDGNYVPVYLSITPYRNENGDIRGFMGVALDMRAKKDLEAKVLHQDRLASIGLIASGLAHEIGTPLSVIRGRAEMLLALHGSSPDLAKSLGIITEQIDRISHFMQSLLNIGRPSLDTNIQRLDLGDLVARVQTLLEQTFRLENVDLSICNELKAKAWGDDKKIEQILLNLLTNALHAVKKAKQRGRDSGHCVSVLLSQQGKEAVMTVADTGIGITPQQMKKLFQPFYTTKDVGEGTGLGLPIALQIAQSLGGSISAESTPGKETRFEVRLRIADDT